MPALRYQDSRRQKLRADANRAPVLDVDTERRYLREASKGCKDSLAALIDSHMRLVISVAERHARHGVSFEDLVSEGILGLMEAARRFDPSRGNRFGTYASWWVRAYVRRFAMANRRMVAAPSTRNARRVLWALRRTERDLSQREGRPATREEVAEELGVPAEEVASVQAVLSGIDVSIGPVEGEGPGFDPAALAPSPEEDAATAEIEEQNRARITEALAQLTEREQEVVRHRLLAEDTTSLAALGEVFGVSRERVRQIQQRAQTKLRSTLLEQVA